MPRTSFRIVIEGTGQHHEGSTQDADYIAQRLATELSSAGHALGSVEFTPGGPNPSQGVYALHPSDSLGHEPPEVVDQPAVVFDEADPFVEG